jgi:mannosyltransferase OCH1-like enzyme
VYADLDIECFRSLAPLMGDAALVLSYKQGANFSRGVGNSIFGSAPRHPFWTEACLIEC